MYRSVVLGGTFDGLHAGHERILMRAFGEGERVTIGLTSDQFVRQLKAESGAKSFEERKVALTQWLKERGWFERATIVPIDDAYGPPAPSSHHAPAPQEDFDAIVVSSQTRTTAEKMNQMRKDAGWKELAIVEVPMAMSSDGKPISSTRVRNHEIDATGHLVMPESLRSTLQQPIGRLIVGDENIRAAVIRHKGATCITVGDIATKTFLDAGVIPALSIIDYMVARAPYRTHEEKIRELRLPTTTVVSGPGHISKNAYDAIHAWGRSVAAGDTTPALIIVEGEEDLLTLPVVTEAPIGALVYYGQPPMSSWARFAGATVRRASGSIYEGLVEVEVTEEKKREIVGLLAQFTNPTNTPIRPINKYYK